MVDLINHSFEKLLELALSDFARTAEPRARAPIHQAPPIMPAGDVVRNIAIPALAMSPDKAAGAGDEVLVRPRHRPPVPVLTVLDDGSLEHGQEIRIRTDLFVIGRTSGDLVIPIDATLSARHAELSLTPHGDRNVWTLHDLGSSNRTFVRVQTATLLPSVVILIGRRRFQLRPATSESLVPMRKHATCQFLQQPSIQECFDTLIELPGTSSQGRFTLSSQQILLGRDPGRCGIHLDDPTIADIHAELVRRPDGLWTISALPSRNGLWVSTTMVRLASGCLFQCGEQRFRFVLP